MGKTCLQVKCQIPAKVSKISLYYLLSLIILFFKGGSLKCLNIKRIM